MKGQYLAIFTISGMTNHQQYSFPVDVEIKTKANDTISAILQELTIMYNRIGYPYPHKPKILWNEICITLLTKLN